MPPRRSPTHTHSQLWYLTLCDVQQCVCGSVLWVNYLDLLGKVAKSKLRRAQASNSDPKETRRALDRTLVKTAPWTT